MIAVAGLAVVELSTGRTVHRMLFSNGPLDDESRSYERILTGMLRRTDLDRFYVADIHAHGSEHHEEIEKTGRTCETCERSETP